MDVAGHQGGRELRRNVRAQCRQGKPAEARSRIERDLEQGRPDVRAPHQVRAWRLGPAGDIETRRAAAGPNKMRIALVHALKHSIAPIEASFAQAWPDARLMNLLDDSLS